MVRVHHNDARQEENLPDMLESSNLREAPVWT